LLAAVAAAGDVVGKDLYDAVVSKDRAAADALSTHLVDPMPVADALERFDETYARMVELALRHEIVRVQALMHSADPIKDSGRHDELFRKAAELQRALSQLRAGGVPDLTSVKG
jgi:hypothetical protein